MKGALALRPVFHGPRRPNPRLHPAAPGWAPLLSRRERLDERHLAQPSPRNSILHRHLVNSSPPLTARGRPALRTTPGREAHLHALGLQEPPKFFDFNSHTIRDDGRVVTRPGHAPRHFAELDRPFPLIMCSLSSETGQGPACCCGPCTILRWHPTRPAPPGCQIQAGQERLPDHPPEHQGPGPPASQGEPRMGLPQDPRGAGRPGSKVAASTIWEILRTNGIDPAPRRTGPTWPQFLSSQAEAILACDFFSVDLLDGTQAHVLTVIEHATRRIRILGVTLHPTGDWTAQQAQPPHGPRRPGRRVKFMIRDRGSNFTTAFDAVLAHAGIRTVLCNVGRPHEPDRRTLDRGMPP